MGMGIYKIINVVNNKFYIGSAVNFSRRKARHFSELRNNRHSNSKLQNAWNKYGEQAFIFAIVEEVADKFLLLDAENKWLKDHVGMDYCYNLGVDATAPMLGFTGEKSPTWGYKHTQDALGKISKTSKSRIQSDEEKVKRRKTMQGHHVSATTRAKISQSLSGEGNYWYGKKRPDHGAKVSRAIIAITPDDRHMFYKSITEFREEHAVTPPTVNRALQSGQPLKRGKLKGWRFEYYDPKKEVVDTTLKQA